MNETEKKLKHIMSIVFNIDIKKINLSSSNLNTKNWDSLKHLNLVIAIRCHTIVAPCGVISDSDGANIGSCFQSLIRPWLGERHPRLHEPGHVAIGEWFCWLS